VTHRGGLLRKVEVNLPTRAIGKFDLLVYLSEFRLRVLVERG